MSTTETTPGPRPFHLSGAFAPVADERTLHELEVLGEIPPDLVGTYVRNGPNPRSGRSPAWFVGEGMLHAFRLEGGRALWYRNRYIGGPYPPNTHVIGHAGRILALVETRLPVEVTTELETVGPYDFGGALAASMTAHPKVCPRTGELLFYSYRKEKPHVTAYRADAQGRVIHRVDLEVPAMTFMHDFAITDRHMVFYSLPVLVGDWRSPMPLRWSDDFPARIGVLPRAGSSADVRWFDVAPCTISHVVNAYDEGDAVVLDAVRAPRLMTPHALYRFTLDLASGRAIEKVLDPRFLDFPRVHPAKVGARHRFAYTTELGDFTADGGFGRTVIRQHDMETGQATLHATDDASMPGECVVAPRPGRAREEEAWVLVIVHRKDGGPSELLVLDAERFGAPPVTRVRLPFRVPFGLHGDWIAANSSAE